VPRSRSVFEKVSERLGARGNAFNVIDFNERKVCEVVFNKRGTKPLQKLFYDAENKFFDVQKGLFERPSAD